MPNGQQAIRDRFIRNCWEPFASWYRSTNPFTVKEHGGTPGPLIWSEHDVVLQVALLASQHFGHEFIHMETPLTPQRFDLVITDPKPYLERRTLAQYPYDLAAEFKIVNSEKDKGYTWEAVKSDAVRLREFFQSKTIAVGVACVIDKIGEEKNERHYADIEGATGVTILRCYDR